MKPEYGRLDEFVKNLTAITEEQLEQSSNLRAVIDRFDKWLAGRECIAVSWSEEDLVQLSNEMRQKRIRNHRIEKLFDHWIDMQKSFCDMLTEPKAISLKNALELASIKPVGQLHNGLFDANNTALLFAKIAKNKNYQMEMRPIKREDDRPLCYSLGDLFTPELLAQMNYSDTEPVEEESTPKEEWSFYRWICKWIYGEERVKGAEWEKMKFLHSMKMIDIKERIQSVWKACVPQRL